MIIKCRTCGREFSALPSQNRIYCSVHCSVKSIERHRRPDKTCVVCGTVTTGRPNTAKYCSQQCCNVDKIRKTNDKIRRGEYVHPNKLKRLLIYERGNKCEKCDWAKINEVTGKVPIEMNHIDGNADNNSLSNLELLCPNCHSLTPTFRALNKGNGRVYRRKSPV